MSIKKWSDFREKGKTNEKMKTFSGKSSKKKDKLEFTNQKRYSNSASSEYADEVNQNIIKGKGKLNKKYTNNTSDKEEVTIKDNSLHPPTNETNETNESINNVEIYGKLAKFPEGVKASKAFNWVYNLKDPKLSKKEIWYLMVEKQDNELQMIKYQQKIGVNLTQFIVDLKGYYMEKYKGNKSIVEKISKIRLGGDEVGNISSITNIPNIFVEKNKKMIQKITEDLVRLLG